ncbi:helix-turn-helix transcriptional regulator [Metabacillus fastidiosus]|uniref:helix-turn-helix transcriptional regulator n=1 Tax=Metabacillus fastidiosus TaxID=1458 RepID=UPI003D284A90
MNIEELIKSKGLKKGWVAEQAKISATTFSLIVKGKSVPTLPVALRIARVLDTTVEELWGKLID